jgi:hypothetical protein
MTTVDAERAFSYLLGELPDSEASQLDEAALGEAETHELLEAFEAELFDAYLDAALSGDRRARFERRFLSTATGRERLRRARARRRVAAPRVESTDVSWWQRLTRLLTVPRLAVGGLVAAALALVVAWPTAPSEARVSLRPDLVRAAGEARRVEAPSASATLVFELALEDAPAASAWTASVSGPAGFTWRGTPVRADAVAAEVKVSGVQWTSGRYQVSLTSGAETLQYEVEVVVQ